MQDLPDYMLLLKNKSSLSVSPHRQKGESMCLNSFVEPGKTLESQISILEKEIIKSSLDRTHYSITKTANELNISRQTLYSKINKYKLL